MSDEYKIPIYYYHVAEEPSSYYRQHIEDTNESTYQTYRTDILNDRQTNRETEPRVHDNLTNTDLPDRYRRPITETIMNPIGQNIPVILSTFIWKL